MGRRTIPLGAIAVHLGIGSVYAWSTLNLPLIAAMPTMPRWAAPPYSTFTTALVLLGLSAALLGPWVERCGPRLAARSAAVFFSSGLALGGLAVVLQQPLLLFLGLGILCGIGCGIGYIAPVSTLVRWFPDRRGLATGLAIMGFGGGAFLGSYANAALIARFGVAATLFVLAGSYLLLMLAGAQLLRQPPAAAQAPGSSGPAAPRTPASGLSRGQAIRHPQFALLWGMLCINVTAGIGILAQASPMMQELFGKTPAEAAGVVALISLFNAGGRLVWSSLSDRLGRRTTFLVFFTGQAVLFLLIPRLATAGAGDHHPAGSPRQGGASPRRLQGAHLRPTAGGAGGFAGLRRAAHPSGASAAAAASGLTPRMQRLAAAAPGTRSTLIRRSKVTKRPPWLTARASR